MTLSEFRRELIYPLTDGAIIGAMMFFFVCFEIVAAAGALGMLLLAILIPAYLRYLLYLLEARANGRKPPVPDIEVFSIFGNLWALAPAIPLGIAMALPVFFGPEVWALVRLPVSILIVVFFPASLAVLAITHSPAESLNPFAIRRMIAGCGTQYFFVPATIVGLAIANNSLVHTPTPHIIIDFVNLYLTTLMFTFTGQVVNQSGLAAEIGIDEPLEKGPDAVAVDLVRSREKAASHAYGLMSRGNRQGGFQHIREQIDAEPDRITASAWFFQEMMNWENKDHALFFAQEYLPLLLANDMAAEALKLTTTCASENPRWRPLQEHRGELRDVAQKHGRQDVVQFLDGKGGALLD